LNIAPWAIDSVNGGFLYRLASALDVIVAGLEAEVLGIDEAGLLDSGGDIDLPPVLSVVACDYFLLDSNGDVNRAPVFSVVALFAVEISF